MEGKMRAIAYGAVAALTVTAASAEPDRKSANFMLPFCKTALAEAVGDVHVDTQTAAMGGLCLGVISGVAFMLDGSDGASCASLPKDVTTEQLARVVIRYTEGRPIAMNERFHFFVVAALMDAWPCQK
jgi:hypothetical protein